MHGDITTERRLNPRERVRGLVLQSLKLNGYRWKDIARIVQISDTDGAFIPDECVRESDDGEIHYGEDGICAGNVDVLRERNARKKRAMRELAGISTITYQGTGIPYSMYFFSRNMEHALHNVSEELSDNKKVQLAQQFRRRYATHIDEFKKFIASANVAIDGDYRETWQRIGSGTASLHRGSNLHLLIANSPAPSPESATGANEN